MSKERRDVILHALCDSCNGPSMLWRISSWTKDTCCTRIDVFLVHIKDITLTGQDQPQLGVATVPLLWCLLKGLFACHRHLFFYPPHPDHPPLSGENGCDPYSISLCDGFELPIASLRIPLNAYQETVQSNFITLQNTPSQLGLSVTMFGTKLYKVFNTKISRRGNYGNTTQKNICVRLYTLHILGNNFDGAWLCCSLYIFIIFCRDS